MAERKDSDANKRHDNRTQIAGKDKKKTVEIRANVVATAMSSHCALVFAIKLRSLCLQSIKIAFCRASTRRKKTIVFFLVFCLFVVIVIWMFVIFHSLIGFPGKSYFFLSFSVCA